MRWVVVTWCLLPLACEPVLPSKTDAGLLFPDAGTSERDGGWDAGAEPDGGSDAGQTAQDAGAMDAGLMDAGPTDAGVADAGRDPLVVARPFQVTVPVGYRSDQPIPLVVVLHGYTATADLQDTYFGFSRLAQQRTFLVALPNGLRDAATFQYWNATDSCCAFGKTNDDVAYLTAVIRDVQARYAVDPKRIFLVGHSNGGFMSHRLGCDRAPLIAAFAALAGSTWNDPSRCAPSEGVAALQIHGTLDPVILYGGGSTIGGQANVVGPPYPSAEDSVRTWGVKNGCSGTSLTRLNGDLNLVSTLLGDETERREVSGCPGRTAAELWTIRGAGHFPVLNDDFADRVYTWLLAHSKP